MGLDKSQHRIDSVRRNILGEVDPGRHRLEQATSENEQGGMRRGGADSARFDGGEPVAAVAVGAAPAEPGEAALISPQRSCAACDRTGLIWLPDFYHRIGHRIPGAVKHLALDSDRTWVPGRYELGALRIWQREAKERPDGLRRGAHHASNGVAPRTMSHW
jgi:hypothetical protein